MSVLVQPDDSSSTLTQGAITINGEAPITTILISNLHCGSCVRTIEEALSALSPPPTCIQVSVVSQSVTYRRPEQLSPAVIQSTLENAGFDVFHGPSPTTDHRNTAISNAVDRVRADRRRTHTQQCPVCQEEESRASHDTKVAPNQRPLDLDPIKEIPHDATLTAEKFIYSDSDSKSSVASHVDKFEDGPFRVTLSVGGMTCASCSGTITKMVSALAGVSEVAVSFLAKSATLVVDKRESVEEVVETVECCGFEAEVMSVETLNAADFDSSLRTLSLRIDGMYCKLCPEKVVAAVESLGPQITIVKPITSYTDCVLEVSYRPSSPSFTIRTIISSIASATSFNVSIYQPPTLEERSRSMQAKEQFALLSRLIFAALIGIPTFIIGVVFLSLVKQSNSTKAFLVKPMWTGNASRSQWALFFLATPVQFYSANLFHQRSIQEIRALWRKGSTTPVYQRFIRFGSMNLLVSTGVTVAYLSSIALMALAAAEPASPSGFGDTTTYFDSVVFLTMFLLAGRYLEAYSKARTADAISALGLLRPTEALLLSTASSDSSTPSSYFKNDDLEKGDSHLAADAKPINLGFKVEKIDASLLEVGDIVRIQSGATPPADATIVSGTDSAFDESSLTGESRLIKKALGEKVFLGTINKGGMVDARVDAIGGATMLDHIVKVVREGQTRRAPIERVADLITGYFVPVVTLLAIITWVIWLCLGLGGCLPPDYLNISVGGWPVWSLEFAIAVFVVACPCGIALAAPTALLVGSGLAAQFGILARGGGEAFQEMAQVDVVVFDKTGTLTEGGEPTVSDFEILESVGDRWDQKTVLGIAAELESASSHPLGIAIRSFCEGQGASSLTGVMFEEVAGRGLKAQFEDQRCTAIIGNEAWLEEHGCVLDGVVDRRLGTWKSEAKSVVLLAMHEQPEDGEDSKAFVVAAIFAITDRLRPEAQGVVSFLQHQGIGTWMISGDNAVTARAVAQMVGIPAAHVIAGVLPHEKAQKIQWLQQVGSKRAESSWRMMFSKQRLNERCIVAMVGDGINDAPALVAADIGVAIGSGSDVAISSASFILLSSNLQSLLTLCDLSRKVFNRVKFNFLYAAMYNCIALPIAAGVVYPAGHVRLAPVWASLAMALSSVSVVCSSLLLKLYKEPKISVARN